jgi:hypothetical protein
VTSSRDVVATKATGDLASVGELDMVSGATVFRYAGKVCRTGSTAGEEDYV